MQYLASALARCKEHPLPVKDVLAAGATLAAARNLLHHPQIPLAAVAYATSGRPLKRNCGALRGVDGSLGDVCSQVVGGPVPLQHLVSIAVENKQELFKDMAITPHRVFLALLNLAHQNNMSHLGQSGLLEAAKQQEAHDQNSKSGAQPASISQAWVEGAIVLLVQDVDEVSVVMMA